MGHLTILKDDKARRWIFLIIIAALVLLPLVAGIAFAQGEKSALEYRDFPIKGIGSRIAIWFIAQLHLTFAAFVLGVPMFAVILECVGALTKNEKYDRVAKDFIKLCLMAYSVTALFGGMLSFLLIILYPKVWNYLVNIFFPTMYFYAFLLIAETFVLYVYYYSWDTLRDEVKVKGGIYENLGKGAGWAIILSSIFLIIGIVFFPYPLIKRILLPIAIKLTSYPNLVVVLAGLAVLMFAFCFVSSRKLFHITLGIFLNLLGTTLMVTANLWLSFMKSPGHAVYEGGEKIIQWAINTDTGELLSLLTAILNETWKPVNIHRFVANICVGGCIAAAYAAYRFLSSKSEEERAYYDWMGYTGNFIAMMALIPLPFAGYYLGREVYAWNEQMGVNMMGGHFSWFFIMQAILIGIMFFGANYYLWLGLDRIPGGQRYMKFVSSMEFLLIVSFIIWITPHNPVATAAEIREIGGPFHPLIKHFGVMAWKLTFINIIILTTFLSFLLYSRANKKPVVEFTRIQKVRNVAIIVTILIVIPLIGYYDFTDGILKIEDLGKEMTLLHLGLLKYLLVLLVWITNIINAFLFLRRPKKAESFVGDIVGVNLLKMETLLVLLVVHGVWYLNYFHYFLAGLFATAALFNAYILLLKRQKVALVSLDATGSLMQSLIMALTCAIVLWLGYHGYLSDDATRLADSIWQVVWVLVCMILIASTDAFLLMPAGGLGEIKWGKMPVRSQYILFMIAVAFVLTMSLMGTVRSGLRGPWHVFGYMKDTSLESYHPSLAMAARMWAIINFIFFLLVAFIFWLGTIGERKPEKELAERIEAEKEVGLLAGPPGAIGEPGIAGARGSPGSSS